MCCTTQSHNGGLNKIITATQQFYTRGAQQSDNAQFRFGFEIAKSSE